MVAWVAFDDFHLNPLNQNLLLAYPSGLPEMFAQVEFQLRKVVTAALGGFGVDGELGVDIVGDGAFPLFSHFPCANDWRLPHVVCGAAAEVMAEQVQEV